MEKQHAATMQARNLTHTLGQTEHIKDVVEECAAELSSVNDILGEKVADHVSIPEVTLAIEQSEAVETKVQECAKQLSAVSHSLEEEVEERQRLEHQLISVQHQEEMARHASFHDPLTGLPNRVLFNDRLEHALSQAKRYGWTLAVMFVDLDDFKTINDTYGHEVGDIVLKNIADRLKRTSRANDTISRQGGDEFLYLMLELNDEHHIVDIAKKLVNVVKQPCDIKNKSLDISPTITPSIGISIYPKDGTTPDDLIKNADKAMYKAKRRKLGYAFFS